MKLLLFDIDGTVLSSGGAGTRSMNLAFKQIYSKDNGFSGINMAGKTDIQIIKEALALHGITFEESLLSPFFSSYQKHLRREMVHGSKHLMPGIRELIEHLSGIDSIFMGLLTGNIEAGARIKLDAFGLNKYFPFGAFGSDNEERNELLPMAVSRFRSLTGKDMDYHNCVVIGDTPRDVACAKPYGAATVAVATGPYGTGELKAAGASLVLEDLTGHESFLSFISSF